MESVVYRTLAWCFKEHRLDSHTPPSCCGLSVLLILLGDKGVVPSGSGTALEYFMRTARNLSAETDASRRVETGGGGM